MGHCFDVNSVSTLVWSFNVPTPEEPEETIAEMVPGTCVMPSSERWHCVLTTNEKEVSKGMHLYDWEEHQRSWGDEHLSMRQSDLVAPERALAQAAWVGTKIKQIAVLPPLHPSGKGAGKAQEPRTWRYNHSGLLFIESSEPQRDEDRSRTPLRKGKGKGDPKGKGSGKRGKKSGKTISNPEEEEERTG